jgi:hypothetical protein
MEERRKSVSEKIFLCEVIHGNRTKIDFPFFAISLSINIPSGSLINEYDLGESI